MNNLSYLLQHHPMEPFQNKSLHSWKIQQDTTSTLPAGLCFVACVYSSLSLFDPHDSPTCVEACSEARNISNLRQAIRSCREKHPFFISPYPLTYPFLASYHSIHTQCLSLSLFRLHIIPPLFSCTLLIYKPISSFINDLC